MDFVNSRMSSSSLNDEVAVAAVSGVHALRKGSGGSLLPSGLQEDIEMDEDAYNDEAMPLQDGAVDAVYASEAAEPGSVEPSVADAPSAVPAPANTVADAPPAVPAPANTVAHAPHAVPAPANTVAHAPLAVPAPANTVAHAPLAVPAPANTVAAPANREPSSRVPALSSQAVDHPTPVIEILDDIVKSERRDEDREEAPGTSLAKAVGDDDPQDGCYVAKI